MKPLPIRSDQKFLTIRPVGVKESLVWFSKRGSCDVDTRPTTAPSSVCRHLPRRADIGKPTTRGYVIPETADVCRALRASSDTAGDALAGWPTPFVDGSRADENSADETAHAHTRVAATSADNDRRRDPFIGDLISHRFLADYRRRRDEEERRRAQGEREARMVRRANVCVRPTKTSQLRANQWQPQEQTTQTTLWKLPKFAKCARAHLSTFRRGERRACAVRRAQTSATRPEDDDRTLPNVTPRDTRAEECDRSLNADTDADTGLHE